MKKGMTITYEVDGGLYINITNRCSNRCEFCIRNNGDGAYGSDSLWLVREPTLEEISESVFSRELTKYKEVVFCGYGEPTYRLADAAAAGAVVFHAGTSAGDNGEILTAGGRVLGVSALGEDIAQAISNAYAGVEKISFEGGFYRHDIGAKALKK